MVVARDEGPGIPDLERAMQDGILDGNESGLGLPGARRLMDELEVLLRSAGTSVTMKKWKR
jgi:serine/threonine-protein kinase RsbT